MNVSRPLETTKRDILITNYKQYKLKIKISKTTFNNNMYIVVLYNISNIYILFYSSKIK